MSKLKKVSKYLHNAHYVYRLWYNRRKYPMSVRWKTVIRKELFNNECFILKDGSVFSLCKDGDIEGLCKNRGKHAKNGKQLIQACIEAGGIKCTGIGEYLYYFYTNNGFTPSCWCKFDWKYAPEDATCPEPLIFYYYTKNNRKAITYRDFLYQEPEKNYIEAYKKRDLQLKQYQENEHVCLLKFDIND